MALLKGRGKSLPVANQTSRTTPADGIELTGLSAGLEVAGAKNALGVMTSFRHFQIVCITKH
ncbi:hypothetical protein [Paraburkholderia hospita]|jgi:hypothetical protein|uniref:hypothetical protein n=1 Tax=Paraburkholderia hospita TaxID=169430 RepID=UPI0011786E6E|nr:hypothetical protein [Paraburkholderia hospita]